MTMIRRANPQTLAAHERVLREIIQQIALLGLWRARFFEHAAFYGGTALRLLYGLDRFSEDIDFSLLSPDAEYTLEPSIECIRRELASFGFDTEIESKGGDPIDSAFIRADTKVHLLKIGAEKNISGNVPHGQLMKVKFEIDTNPPPLFTTESRFILEPVPFSVRVYCAEDLFAGKMHAILFRSWKTRVKGRDWYDLIFFIKNTIPLHLDHLAERMKQTKHLDHDKQLYTADFNALLENRIASVDFKRAREDVAPFINDPSQLDIWSAEFFNSICSKITFS